MDMRCWGFGVRIEAPRKKYMVTIIQSVSDCCEANPEMGQNGLQSAFLAATLSRSFGPYAQLVPVETHNFGCYHVYKFHHVFYQSF